MPELTVYTVNLPERHATLTDGQRIPITNFLRGREEIGGPDTATTFVAGPCADGMWYAAQILDEDRDA